LLKKSCATLSKSSDTVKILAAKPQRCALLKKASILPESSAVKKEPQDGRAYNKRETISAWKTV